MNDDSPSLGIRQLSKQLTAVVDASLRLTQMHNVEAIGKEAPNDGNLPVDSLGECDCNP